MSASQDRVTISGSERAPVPGARATGPADRDERLEITVVVRPRPGAGSRHDIEALAARPPQERHYLSREEFEDTRGADRRDLEKVESFAHQFGLEVVQVSTARRSVVLAGPVEALESSFAVRLHRRVSRTGGRTERPDRAGRHRAWRVRTGQPPASPRALSPV